MKDGSRNALYFPRGKLKILLCGYGPGTKDVNKKNLVYQIGSSLDSGFF